MLEILKNPLIYWLVKFLLKSFFFAALYLVPNPFIPFLNPPSYKHYLHLFNFPKRRRGTPQNKNKNMHNYTDKNKIFSSSFFLCFQSFPRREGRLPRRIPKNFRAYLIQKLKTFLQVLDVTLDFQQISIGILRAIFHKKKRKKSKTFFEKYRKDVCLLRKQNNWTAKIIL